MKIQNIIKTMIVIAFIAIMLPKQEVLAKTYTISPKSSLSSGCNYDKSSNYNSKTKTYFMVRSYLQQLEKDGGGTLVLKKGTYNITNSLYVPSNTTIKLEDGVKIVKSDDTGLSSFPAAKSIFQIVPDTKYDGSKPVSKHNSSKNVVISGSSKGKATIDLKGIYGAIGIVTAHNTNVTIENITFKNVNTGHFIEVDAGKEILIQNNKFMNALETEMHNKEAINIDTPDKETGGCTVKWTSYDQTPNEDITIKNNTFTNLERAIGTHKYSASKDKKGKYTQIKYHTNINITNNTFKDIKYMTIVPMAWKNVTIKDNKFTNTKIFEPADYSKTYFNGVAKYQRPWAIFFMGAENVEISNNTLKNMYWYDMQSPHSNTSSGSIYEPVDTNLTEEEINTLNNENDLSNALS